MQITGPHLDTAKRGQPKPWFLRYSTPKTDANGSILRTPDGRPVLQRHRPYYKTKADAEADKPRIVDQHSTTGSGEFLFDRSAAAEFEAARKIAGHVPLTEVAKFWRLHHPEEKSKTLGEWQPVFIADVVSRHGKTRHEGDLRSRLDHFAAAGFRDRLPKTITRKEIISYLINSGGAPRTKLNRKRVLCAFFNWLLSQNAVTENAAGGIKRRELPVIKPKEIGFMTVAEVECYLRSCERYAPEMVAHEIIQFISGVRSDDEMDNFDAAFVLPATREIVIPASIAKTGKREVISAGLEPVFWSWWEVYGKKGGLLRPKNHDPEWRRVRALTLVKDPAHADELAKLPIKILLSLPEVKALMKQNPWPWNARRRSFCTHHVAAHGSADKTALVLRHRGAAETLHNSYRGTGVTVTQGKAYFSIMPSRIDHPIRPQLPEKGVIKTQRIKIQRNHG